MDFRKMRKTVKTVENKMTGIKNYQDLPTEINMLERIIMIII
jgi:hypothetical protein